MSAPLAWQRLRRGAALPIARRYLEDDAIAMVASPDLVTAVRDGQQMTPSYFSVTTWSAL